MNPEEINSAIANICGVHNAVGLKKRGMWYRPNARGYTCNEWEAGRYSMKDAMEHANPDGEPVTIHQFTTPNYYESLDMCALFEGTLIGCNIGIYEHFLGEITQSDALALRRCFVGERMRLIRATPPQRCEAFLKTFECAGKGAE